VEEEPSGGRGLRGRPGAQCAYVGRPEVDQVGPPGGSVDPPMCSPPYGKIFSNCSRTEPESDAISGTYASQRSFGHRHSKSRKCPKWFAYSIRPVNGYGSWILKLMCAPPAHGGSARAGSSRDRLFSSSISSAPTIARVSLAIQSGQAQIERSSPAFYARVRRQRAR